VRAGITLGRTWHALRPRRRGRARERAAADDDGFAPGEREWLRLHVAACIAAFAGWLVCAQFGSIGYYWTLYYILGMSAAAYAITLDRLGPAATARGAAA
jgi:hypothetical protein